MFDLQQLIEVDKNLLLALNGSDSLFWDGFMWTVTKTATWIPALLTLLYVIFKNNRLNQSLVLFAMLALTVLLSDQISSGICKPYFARFRPTQDPELMYLVQTVHGYRGGLYGFISSHAANTFTVALFISLLIRNWGVTVMMFIWAFTPSYSRIYLGVHYPGDILFGALCGCLVALLVYWLYTFIQKRWLDSAGYTANRYAYPKKRYNPQHLYLLHGVLLLTYFYAIVMGMITVKTSGS